MEINIDKHCENNFENDHNNHNEAYDNDKSPRIPTLEDIGRFGRTAFDTTLHTAVDFPTRIRNILTSQDFQQKTNMVVAVSLELYRVMVSSLLIMFVPQKCGQNVCTMMENLNYENSRAYFIGLVINYVTASIFLLMYFTEIRREEKLIKLLEVNNTISTDNTSVGKRIEVLEEYKKKQLFDVDWQYQYASYLCVVVFVVNTVYSGNIIYDYSLGNQTLINFTTNVLFMVSKLSNVIAITRTDKNVFFSAYLNTKVQFNDVDPRELMKIERKRRHDQIMREVEMTGGRCLLYDASELHDSMDTESRIRFVRDGGFEIVDFGMYE